MSYLQSVMPVESEDQEQPPSGLSTYKKVISNIRDDTPCHTTKTEKERQKARKIEQSRKKKKKEEEETRKEEEKEERKRKVKDNRKTSGHSFLQALKMTNERERVRVVVVVVTVV